MEQRQHIRLYGNYSIQVRIAEPNERLNFFTVTDNIGEGGLYMQIPHTVDVGASLFLVVGLPTGAKLASFGRVLRTEPKSHGLFGIAVQFWRSRLLHGKMSEINAIGE